MKTTDPYAPIDTTRKKLQYSNVWSVVAKLFHGGRQRRARPTTAVAGSSNDDKALMSDLPDSLLIEILSMLPLNEAVRTSALSQRWRHMWKYIDRLDFKIVGNSCLYSKVLLERSSLYMPKVKTLRIEFENRCLSNPDELEKLVGFGKEKCVEDLCVVNGYVAPKNIFSSKTLKKLELEFLDIELPTSICLPSLQDLVLSRTMLGDSNTLHLLVSNCPTLANLSLINCVSPQPLELDTRISTVLKTLRIVCERKFPDPTLKIGLPSVEYLELQGPSCMGTNCVIKKNMVSLRKVFLSFYSGIDVGFETAAWWNITKNLSHMEALKLQVNGVDKGRHDMPLRSSMITRSLELVTSVICSNHIRSMYYLFSCTPYLENLRILDYEYDFNVDDTECWKHVKYSFSSLLPQLREVTIHLSTSGAHNYKCKGGFEEDIWLEKKLQLVKNLLESSKTLAKLVIVPTSWYLHWLSSTCQYLWEPNLLLKLRRNLLRFKKASPGVKILIHETM